MLKGLSMGIDLGSTYSNVFIYKPDENKFEPFNVTAGSPIVPSIVSFNPTSGVYDFGLNAKNVTNKKTKVFKAFKMLLSEKNADILLDRRYDPIPDEDIPEEEYRKLNTPENITRRFIDYMIQAVLFNIQDAEADYVSSLVVGFPEVWNDVDTQETRVLLKEICEDLLKEINKSKGLDVQSHVIVRTEPECATAFITGKLNDTTGDNYNGNILIVDYGGGTLDITLSSVNTGDDGTIEITPLSHKGIGENNTKEKQIGNAGIIYMESVIERAIREAFDMDPGEPVTHDNKFYKAVNEFENALTSPLQRTRLRNTMATYSYDEEELEELQEDDFQEWLFTSVEFEGAGDNDELLISFHLLLKVYHEVIAPSFARELEAVMADMKREGIDYMNPETDQLKIALVGGFGKFLLVRHQLEEIFHIKSHDKRDMKFTENEAELAIGNGACIIASGAMKIINRSHLSIGMMQQEGKKIQMAIHYGQIIDPKEIYYCRDQENNCYKFWLEGAGITEFWINYSSQPEFAHKGILRSELQAQLGGIGELGGPPVIIGFSMDDSDILTMHIQEFDVLRKRPEGKHYQYILSRYDKMFEISAFL